jgi:hypothetical protein
MTGFAINHKTFLQMTLRSLQTTGLNVFRSKEIILKSNVFVMSLTYIKISLKNKVQKLFEVPSYKWEWYIQ